MNASTYKTVETIGEYIIDERQGPAGQPGERAFLIGKKRADHATEYVGGGDTLEQARAQVAEL